MLRIVVLFIVLFSVALPTGAGERPPDAAVLKAVERALPFLEKIGTDWMSGKKCNSCHNVTFLVWTHHAAAAAHGLDVDRKKLAEWTKWSLDDALEDNHWFGVRQGTFVELKQAGFPDALAVKLKPLLGKNHTTRENYDETLKNALGADELKRHRELLFRVSTMPNNGGGPDTLGQLLLGRTAEPVDNETAASYAAVRRLLVEWQEPDGTWATQGQLPSINWSAEEMHEATTMWSVLALANDPPGKASGDDTQRITRALESLKKSESGATVQSLALHTIVAQRFGDPDRAAALRKKLLDRQRPDGGWSWTAAKEKGEAFSTGQALYALALTGPRENDEAGGAIARGIEFLLQTQTEDGSWHVPQDAVNRGPRKLNVYPFWGTAWAVLGLLETIPR